MMEKHSRYVSHSSFCRCWLRLAAATVALAWSPVAMSAVINVGTEVTTSGQNLPFFGGGILHHVYSSSLFSTSFRIDELRFFRRSVGSGGSTIDRTTYTIGMSVTSRTAGAGSANPLSTTLADNITGPETVFFSASKGGAGDSLGPNNDVLFAGSTPFVYDPTLGDLLVTISKSSNPTSGSFAGDLSIAYSEDPSGSAFSFVSASAPGDTTASVSNLGRGLITQFDGVALASAAAVPEPQSFAMLLFAALAVGFRWRRRSNIDAA